MASHFRNTVNIDNPQATSPAELQVYQDTTIASDQETVAMDSQRRWDILFEGNIEDTTPGSFSWLKAEESPSTVGETETPERNNSTVEEVSECVLVGSLSGVDTISESKLEAEIRLNPEESESKVEVIETYEETKSPESPPSKAVQENAASSHVGINDVQIDPEAHPTSMDSTEVLHSSCRTAHIPGKSLHAASLDSEDLANKDENATVIEDGNPELPGLCLEDQIEQLKKQIASSQSRAEATVTKISENEKRIQQLSATLKRKKTHTVDESAQVSAKKPKTPAYRRPSTRKEAKPKVPKCKAPKATPRPRTANTKESQSVAHAQDQAWEQRNYQPNTFYGLSSASGIGPQSAPALEYSQLLYKPETQSQNAYPSNNSGYAQNLGSHLIPPFRPNALPYKPETQSQNANPSNNSGYTQNLGSHVIPPFHPNVYQQVPHGSRAPIQNRYPSNGLNYGPAYGQNTGSHPTQSSLANGYAQFPMGPGVVQAQNVQNAYSSGPSSNGPNFTSQYNQVAGANLYPSNVYSSNAYPPNFNPSSVHASVPNPASQFKHPPNVYPPNVYPPNFNPSSVHASVPNPASQFKHPPNVYPPNVHPPNFNPSSVHASVPNPASQFKHPPNFNPSSVQASVLNPAGQFKHPSSVHASVPNPAGQFKHASYPSGYPSSIYATAPNTRGQVKKAGCTYGDPLKAPTSDPNTRNQFRQSVPSNRNSSNVLTSMQNIGSHFNQTPHPNGYTSNITTSAQNIGSYSNQTAHPNGYTSNITTSAQNIGSYSNQTAHPNGYTSNITTSAQNIGSHLDQTAHPNGYTSNITTSAQAPGTQYDAASIGTDWIFNDDELYLPGQFDVNGFPVFSFDHPKKSPAGTGTGTGN